MKKITIIFFFIFTLILSTAVFATASELDNITEEENSMVQNEAENASPDAFHKFVDRIKESWNKGSLGEVLTLAGALVMLVAAMILKKTMKNICDTIIKAMKGLKESTGESNKELRESVAVCQKKLDALTGDVNAIRESNENAVTKEQMQELKNIGMTQLKMFDGVYQHSKTIPNVIKERLAEDFASVNKAATEERTDENT